MATLPPNKLEHLGINVFDLEAMTRFYCDVMGFTVSDRGLRFNGQKVAFLTKDPREHHQFVLAEGRPVGSESNIINQISFAFSGLDDLRTAFKLLTEMGMNNIIQVNHGNAWSLYVRDPEGNMLELFVDAPWHTPQPARGELDITRPNAVIMAETEALCREHGGFATRQAWQADLAARIDRETASY